jgi:hypothetical protein
MQQQHLPFSSSGTARPEIREEQEQHILRNVGNVSLHIMCNVFMIRDTHTVCDICANSIHSICSPTSALRHLQHLRRQHHPQHLLFGISIVCDLWSTLIHDTFIDVIRQHFRDLRSEHFCRATATGNLRLTAADQSTRQFSIYQQYQQ